MNTKHRKIDVVVHQTTKAGRPVCGDSYFFIETETYFACVVADGLGSGTYAKEASQAVIDVVQKHHQEDVDRLMRRSNQALQNKRGAAVALFKIDPLKRELDYSCVGNIRFYLYSRDGDLVYPMPVTGYLSGRPTMFRTTKLSYERNSKFLIYSDGMNPNGVRELLGRDGSIQWVAEELIEKYSSSADDSTFIVGSLR